VHPIADRGRRDGVNAAEHHQKTLSTGDLVAMLGVSRTTIHRWAVSGQLPSFKTLGGHHRFVEAEVMPVLRRRGFTRADAGWAADRRIAR
jgi:excisionase family DNA binding protein